MEHKLERSSSQLGFSGQWRERPCKDAWPSGPLVPFVIYQSSRLQSTKRRSRSSCLLSACWAKVQTRKPCHWSSNPLHARLHRIPKTYAGPLSKLYCSGSAPRSHADSAPPSERPKGRQPPSRRQRGLSACAGIVLCGPVWRQPLQLPAAPHGFPPAACSHCHCARRF